MRVGMLAPAISTALTLGQGHYLLSLVIWNGGALSQDSWHGVIRLTVVLVLGAAVQAPRGAAAQQEGARARDVTECNSASLHVELTARWLDH